MTRKQRKRSGASPKPLSRRAFESFRSVVLEEGRAHNRALREILRSFEQWFIKKMDDSFAKQGKVLDLLILAVQQNGVDIRKNGEAIRKNGEAIRKNSEAIRKNSEAIRKNSEAIRAPRKQVQGLELETEGLSGVVDNLPDQMILSQGRVEEVEAVVQVPAHSKASARSTPPRRPRRSPKSRTLPRRGRVPRPYSIDEA